MQNRYTGDVGDFGKFGMLRAIFRRNDLRLGVNWYLVPDEDHNNDGKFTSYLLSDKEKEFKPCDPELYDQLKNILRVNMRSVRRIQDIGILPPNTVFYDVPLSFNSIGRVQQREQWNLAALQILKDCDIVFLDPDNGLEVKSYSKASTAGGKYVFYDELNGYYAKGQSLIIYNHRDRKPEAEYIKRFSRIRDFVDGIGDMFYLRYNRFSVRDYVYMLQPEHAKIVRKRLKAMIEGEWGRNFSFYDL